jgi:hypothetical protein
MIGVTEPPAQNSNKAAPKPAQPMAAADENEMAPPGEGDETFDPILTAQEPAWPSIGMVFGFVTTDFAKPKHRHHHPNHSPAASPPAKSPADGSDGTTLAQTLSPSVDPTMGLASDAMQDTGTFALAPTTFETGLSIIPLSQPSLETIANDPPALVINQIVAPGMTTTAALMNNLAPLQTVVHNAQSLAAAAISATSGAAVQAATQVLASQSLGSISSPLAISPLSSSLPPTTSLLSPTSLPSAVTSLGEASSLAHAALDSVTDPGTLTPASAPLANSSPVVSLSQRRAGTIANDRPASVITQILHPDTTAVTTTAAATPQMVTNNSLNARLQNLIRDAQSLSPTATSSSSGAARARMQSFTSQVLRGVSSPSSISSLSPSLRPTTSLHSAASLPSAPTSSLGGAASLTRGAMHSVSSGHH